LEVAFCTPFVNLQQLADAMLTHRTTHHRWIDCLLVLAIAFAPLRGALSAYQDGCEHASDTVATQMNGLAAAADTVTGHDHSGAAHDCCKQGCDCNDCAGACSLVHATFYLPSPILVFLNTHHTAYEAQSMTFHIGRAFPPLFHPPRVST